MSSFVSPNQDFHTTIGGCAGTYTAFGAIDAERAGIEAAKEVITCLTLDDCETQLTSWLVSKAAIMNAGYRLSPRGLSFTDESLVRRRDVARADCPICFGGNQ
jgi:hypothetical protein